EADIVGLLTTSVSTGTVLDDPTERLSEKVQQKLAWIREGAAAKSATRFDELELSLIPSFTLTEDRQGYAEQLIQERGWNGISVDQVLAMPSQLIGTLDEIVAEMIVRREQYGFSYYVIDDSEMEQLAPLVARLNGK
ncbi:MAG TPA: hypothetical protein VHL11_00620, partial [Phototrophicaceae bacterium]|nr:hypothetical protein [Phototrophicaceae bacterium]